MGAAKQPCRLFFAHIPDLRELATQTILAQVVVNPISRFPQQTVKRLRFGHVLFLNLVHG